MADRPPAKSGGFGSFCFGLPFRNEPAHTHHVFVSASTTDVKPSAAADIVAPLRVVSASGLKGALSAPVTAHPVAAAAVGSPPRLSMTHQASCENCRSRSRGQHTSDVPQSPTDDVQAAIVTLAEALRQLNGVQGPWLQQLHAAVVVLNKQLHGQLVSVAALLEGGYSYAVLAADGVGASDLLVGVPHVVRATSRPSSSLQRVFQSEAPVCASVMKSSDGSPFTMPPDWHAHASRHGTTDFVAVPVHRGGTVVGALSVAYNISVHPHPWLLTPSGLNLVAPSLGGLFRSEQLLLLLSMLEDLSGVKDIDTLVKVLARGVSELCAFATYLVPQCRVALVREDGLAAAVFEEPTPRRQSQLVTSESSYVALSAPPTPNGTPPFGGESLAASPMEPTGHAAGRQAPLQLDLASYLNAAPGEWQQQAQLAAAPPPFVARGRMARCSSGQPGGGAPATTNSGLAGVPRFHSSHLKTPSGTAAGQSSMRGHSLLLSQTLLGEAIQKRSGVWISDCSIYLQEIKVMPLDITISRNSRTINSLAVCAACIPGTTKPLLGIYCTYPATVPPLLLRAVTRELEQLLQALLPMVHTLLQSDVSAEWKYLHDEVLDPLELSCARQQQQGTASSGSYANTPQATPRVSVAGNTTLAGIPPNAHLTAAVGSRMVTPISLPPPASRPLASPLSSSQQPGGPSPAESSRGSKEAQRRQRLNDNRLSTSFNIQASATAGINGTLGPLLLGMQDKLRSLQASRLLNTGVDDQLEELGGIELLEKVGFGGYGSVYRGTLQGLEVAVKIIFSKVSTPAGLPHGGCQRRSPGSAYAAAREHALYIHAAMPPSFPPIRPTGLLDAEAERRQLEEHQTSHLHQALELAVLFSVAHPNIVQVLNFFADVTVCAEGPDGMPPLAALTSAEDGALPRILLLPTAKPKAPPSLAHTFAAAYGGIDPIVAAAAARELEDEAEPACRQAMVICMEYCDSGSLLDAIQRGSFRERSQGLYGSSGLPNMQAIYTTLLEMAMALRHLHSLDLVHCDLKPANVLLRSTARDPRGFVCKLSDFGLVRLMVEDEAGRMVVRDHDSGTHTHMAPEVLSSGEGVIMDASLDVYAFGIIMWQLVTGSRVYAGLRPEEVVDKVVHHALRPRFPPSVDAAFSSLATACWSAERMQRPTAPELVNQLKALMLASSPLHAVRARRNSSTAYMVANTAATVRKAPPTVLTRTTTEGDGEDGAEGHPAAPLSPHRTVSPRLASNLSGPQLLVPPLELGEGGQSTHSGGART